MGRQDTSGNVGSNYQELGELRVRCQHLQAENAKYKQRVSKLTSECLTVENDLSESYKRINGAKEEKRLLQAENERLKELLQAALPNIECKNNSQSGLITEIGEFLSEP